ncbi:MULTISPECIES: transglycosylase SLT domain-containing protein [unclassified Streptomyces]|uniref:aggregation-promoting factor C-terminal-like domain-containing protein n=1 Tax=unclassified Streptomyces TaxID=2593676 RepID=UPI003827320C
MSRISVRGFAVASATAVTTVGAVVGVASGDPQTTSNDNFEATAADMTLLADIPAGQQAQVQTASLTQQADVQAAAADASAKKSAEESARVQAAKDATAKKQAAEDKAEEEREAAAQKKKEEEERASRDEIRSSTAPGDGYFPPQASYTVAEVQALAQQIIPADQFQCFSNIVNHESTWNYQAQNPSSGAYGLVQALPGSKMSSVGADWQTNPATQIKWGLNYMNERYDSPCGAWSFWQANNWY